MPSAWAEATKSKSLPYVQRALAQGFSLNDLSWSSTQVDDFMSWVRDGKLGDEQSLFYGGTLTADLQSWNADAGLLDTTGAPVNSNSTVFLQNARLITAGKISDEVAFAYGYAAVAQTTMFGFATISPKNTNWYGAAGHMILPFAYLNGAGAPYTFEIILDAYQIKNDAVLLGYKADNFHASASLFKPSASFQRSLSDYIINAEYNVKLSNGVKVTLGGSYLNDLRGLTSSQVGNLWTTRSDPKIGVYTVRSYIEYENLKLTGELINNLSSSALTDNRKASMQAASLSYGGIKLFNHMHRVMLSYNHTNNMSQVPLTLGGFTTARASIKSQWLAAVLIDVYKTQNLAVNFYFLKPTQIITLLVRRLI